MLRSKHVFDEMKKEFIGENFVFNDLSNTLKANGWPIRQDGTVDFTKPL